MLFPGHPAKAFQKVLRHLGRQSLRQEAVTRISVLRDECIQINERFDSFRHAIGHSCDDHAAIGMTAQDNLVEFFSFNAADDVTNVSFERDCLA